MSSLVVGTELLGDRFDGTGALAGSTSTSGHAWVVPNQSTPVRDNGALVWPTYPNDKDTLRLNGVANPNIAANMFRLWFVPNSATPMLSVGLGNSSAWSINIQLAAGHRANPADYGSWLQGPSFEVFVGHISGTVETSQRLMAGFLPALTAGVVTELRLAYIPSTDTTTFRVNDTVLGTVSGVGVTISGSTLADAWRTTQSLSLSVTRNWDNILGDTPTKPNILSFQDVSLLAVADNGGGGGTTGGGGWVFGHAASGGGNGWAFG